MYIKNFLHLDLKKNFKESNTIDEEHKSKIDALWAELNADDDDYPSIPQKHDNLVNDKGLLSEKPVEDITEKEKVYFLIYIQFFF